MKIKDIKRQNITNITNNIYGDMKMNNKNIKINPILVKKSKKPSNIKLKIIGNNFNNLSKNKNVKFIKPKQNNIQISPNNSKLKRYSKIFKKSTNISHQNLENYQRQVKSNKSHFKKIISEYKIYLQILVKISKEK